MSTNLSSVPKLQFFDNNGNPLVGGKLFTYAAGTTTPLATYTDSTGVTPNTNPIILDSRGEANVWLDATQYKFELKTSADALIWTVDNISNALNLSQLLASSGSAASPPYTFAADTTTGMFLAAAGQIGLSANGTPVFRSTDTQAVLDVNLQVSGTARRITGDFSNATAASRVMFQTSTTNGSTSISALPNGTSTATAFTAFANADPTNASISQVLCNGTESRFAADRNGSGTYLPMTFYTGGSERVRIDTSGNVGIGTSSPNTRLTIGGYSSVNQTPDIQITRSSSGTTIQTGPNITFGDGTTNNSTTIQVTQGRFGVWNYGAGAWNERMSIDSSGNVGIGTTTPQGKFNVSSGTSFFGANSQTYSIGVGYSQVRVSASQTYYVGATDSATPDMVFSNSAGTERARLTDTGNFQFNSGYGSVATAFGCRAWINFNGTGTPAARASGNVSSITDNGTGDYTINFTNAMPDGNYAPVFGYGQSDAAAGYKFAVRIGTAETGSPTTMTTTALRIISGVPSPTDFANLYVAIFR